MKQINETKKEHAYPYPMMGLKCHNRLNTDRNTHVYWHWKGRWSTNNNMGLKRHG